MHGTSRTFTLKFCAAVLGALISSGAEARGDYKDDVGFTQLLQELGPGFVPGFGVTAAQVEALEGAAYAPDLAHPEFAGKLLTLQSGASTAGNHATIVGQHFYGTSTSLASGIAAIDIYEATNWLSAALRRNTSFAPNLELRDVANFSWVGGGVNSVSDQDILRRFDYQINESNFVAVVGTSNGAAQFVPVLLAQNYNGITVGRSDGQHGWGVTTLDVAGRQKPDLVAPPSNAATNFTSFTTPLVSGAAAVLIGSARGSAPLANGADSRAVKAMLLAGATKEEFPTWSHTATSPLDPVFGAGELNIYNSYQILTAGEQAPGGLSTGQRGWDLGTASTANLQYFFDIPEGSILERFSAILTWNRVITDTQPGTNFTPGGAFLDNLNLRLFAASGFTIGPLIAESISSVDNVEHIYSQILGPGRYALEVERGTASTAYAVAWTGTLVPEPSSVFLMAVALASVAVCRVRRGQRG